LERRAEKEYLEAIEAWVNYEAPFQYKCFEYVLFKGEITAPPTYGFTNRRDV
jgi:hypothetical protein